MSGFSLAMSAARTGNPWSNAGSRFLSLSEGRVNPIALRRTM